MVKRRRRFVRTKSFQVPLSRLLIPVAPCKGVLGAEAAAGVGQPGVAGRRGAEADSRLPGLPLAPDSGLASWGRAGFRSFVGHDICQWIHAMPRCCT